jgi:uncharacterized protein (DUF362 family)
MYPQFFPKNFERRTFMKALTLAGIGGLVYTSCKKDSTTDGVKPPAVTPQDTTTKAPATVRTITTSKVVTIKDLRASVLEGSIRRYPVNQAVVKKMLDDAIIALSGINTVGEAWKSIFPSITLNTKICIKVNCIASGGGPYVPGNKDTLSSHPEVAYSIANCLTAMIIDGSNFPADNITIFDRSDIEMKNAGYTINKDGAGVKSYGTMPFVNSGNSTNYSQTRYSVNGSDQFLSNIFVNSDYMINLCVMKDHSFAGVTLSMKNNYGVIHMPECTQMHTCDIAVPKLNALEPFKKKQVLCIVDAIYGIKNGGPEGYPQFKPNSLILSKDTVATDTIGTKMLVDNGFNASRVPAYLKTADDTYWLGNNKMANIDHTIIDNSDKPIN